MERVPQPDFERVKAALSGQRPDRVPLAEVGIANHVKEALLGRPVSSLEDDVEFWYQAGYDYFLVGRDLALGLFPGIRYGRPLEKDTSMPSEGEGRAWANEGHGIITNRATFEAYPWPNADRADYTEFEQIGELLAPGVKAIFYSGPIFQWVWMLMGFEGFALALKKDPELVHKMFFRIGQSRLEVLENALQRYSDIGAVWILDDIAYSEGLMVSPLLLRQHLFPWFRRIKAVCQARDVPLLYHSDGTFWQVLDDILDIGIDAIHPVEPKGMGADIPALKAQVGDRLCLVGGVDLDILIRGDQQDVVRETRRKLEQGSPGGGFMIGSSNTVTDSVPLTNYQTMVEASLTYGRY